MARHNLSFRLLGLICILLFYCRHCLSQQIKILPRDYNFCSASGGLWFPSPLYLTGDNPFRIRPPQISRDASAAIFFFISSTHNNHIVTTASPKPSYTATSVNSFCRRERPGSGVCWSMVIICALQTIPFDGLESAVTKRPVILCLNSMPAITFHVKVLLYILYFCFKVL